MRRPPLLTQQATFGGRLSQRRRLEQLIRRAATDDRIPLPTRVATRLMLLYAQPVSRLLRLPINDVLHQGDGLFLRLGAPPTPVPAPFATLICEFIDNRTRTVADRRL